MSFRKGHLNSKSATGQPTHNVDQATRQATDHHEVYATTLAGDPKKLRGIPAIGLSVAGAIPGTSPHQSVR
jgi:FAD synthase